MATIELAQIRPDYTRQVAPDFFSRVPPRVFDQILCFLSEPDKASLTLTSKSVSKKTLTRELVQETIRIHRISSTLLGRLQRIVLETLDFPEEIRLRGYHIENYISSCAEYFTDELPDTCSRSALSSIREHFDHNICYALSQLPISLYRPLFSDFCDRLETLSAEYKEIRLQLRLIKKAPSSLERIAAFESLLRPYIDRNEFLFIKQLLIRTHFPKEDMQELFYKIVTILFIKGDKDYLEIANRFEDPFERAIFLERISIWLSNDDFLEEAVSVAARIEEVPIRDRTIATIGGAVFSLSPKEESTVTARYSTTLRATKDFFSRKPIDITSPPISQMIDLMDSSDDHVISRNRAHFFELLGNFLLRSDIEMERKLRYLDIVVAQLRLQHREKDGISIMIESIARPSLFSDESLNIIQFFYERGCFEKDSSLRSTFENPPLINGVLHKLIDRLVDGGKHSLARGVFGDMLESPLKSALEIKLKRLGII